MPLDVGGIATAGVGLVAGLFKSKKHYHLYYYELADGTWHFVMDGHPSQVKPAQQQLATQGLSTVLVRNKDGKYQPGELAPKNPPAGQTGKTPSSVNLPLIIAIVAGVGLIIFFFMRRKRKK